MKVGVFDEIGIDGLTVWDMEEGSEWKCIKCFKREWNEKEGHAETRIFIKSLLGKFTQQAHKNFCFCIFFIPPPFKTFYIVQGRGRLL